MAEGKGLLLAKGFTAAAANEQQIAIIARAACSINQLTRCVPGQQGQEQEQQRRLLRGGVATIGTYE